MNLSLGLLRIPKNQNTLERALLVASLAGATARKRVPLYLICGTEKVSQ